MRLFVVDGATGEQTRRSITVPAGATEIELPATVTADTTPGPDVEYRVLAKAGPGTMVGDYVGSLTVQNDDG